MNDSKDSIKALAEEEIKNRIAVSDERSVDNKELIEFYEKAEEADLNREKFKTETELKREEIKQTKIGNWLKIGGTVFTGLLFGWLTLKTQRNDQEFQKEGLGYDNETSKRSQGVLSNFKSLIK